MRELVHHLIGMVLTEVAADLGYGRNLARHGADAAKLWYAWVKTDHDERIATDYTTGIER